MRYVLNEYLGLMTRNGYEAFAEASFDEEFENKYALNREFSKKATIRKLFVLRNESDMRIGRIYGCFRIDTYNDGDDEPIKRENYYFEEKILK